MRTFTWLRAVYGPPNPTFPWQALHIVHAQIERYCNVRFVQKTSGTADMHYICPSKPNDPNWYLWYRSGSYPGIYVPRYRDFAQNVAGACGALRHEWCHPRNMGHSPNLNDLMYYMLLDSYRNWTKYDCENWLFRMFSPKPGAPKPWNEPNIWRTPAAIAAIASEPKPYAGVVHAHPKSTIWERFTSFFEIPIVFPIEPDHSIISSFVLDYSS